MKKLYAVLLILIIIYVGVNVSVNGFSITNTDNNQIYFPSLNKNFSMTKINDTAYNYDDKKNNITIIVQAINDTENVSAIHDKLMKGNTYNSSQKVDEHGITTYYLYKKDATTYDADIFFNKNDTNFMISGKKVPYEKSDYFIKNCKQIISKIKP